MGLRGLETHFFIVNEILLERIRTLTLPLLDEKQVELVDLLLRREGRRLLIRFLVDKPGGITLDECAQLNKEIDRIFEEKNIIQESYILEVSSPGLDRLLKSTRDFQRCQGQKVKVVLHNPINRQNVWLGIADGVDENDIVIRLENGESLRIARENIAKARLAIDGV